MIKNDIRDLRCDCCGWEKRSAFNRARKDEMLQTKQSLDLIVDEKKMVVNELKNDINEFERELLATSYTLDQIPLD
uniref:Uncharacterized protein n=1 Tax=Panagrolaimus davidi TaxID=227884 RepID=A0A914PCB7_9BILA